MGSSHPVAGFIGEEHRQAVGHHDRAGQPGRRGGAGIGGGAVDLLQEDRPGADGLLQATAVLGHMRAIVADMVAEVEALVAAQRNTAITRGAHGPHVRRRGSVRHEPVRIHGVAALDQASASGACEGCARWKASSSMQASKAAMARGRPLKSQSKRRPLKTCGTRQQSASVGVLP